MQRLARMILFKSKNSHLLLASNSVLLLSSLLSRVPSLNFPLNFSFLVQPQQYPTFPEIQPSISSLNSSSLHMLHTGILQLMQIYFESHKQTLQSCNLDAMFDLRTI